jgi:hypothetical protein
MKVVVNPIGSISVKINQPQQQVVHGTSSFFGAYGQESQILEALSQANNALALATSANNSISTAVTDSQVALASATAANTAATTANNAATVAFNEANSALNLVTSKYSANGGTLSGNMQITGNIIPTTSNTYTLGSLVDPFASIYVGPGSVYVDGIKLSNTAGQLTISNSPSINVVGNLSSTGTISGIFDGGLF